MIIDHKLSISKKKKAVLIAELKKLGFKPIDTVEEAAQEGELEPVRENDPESDDDTQLGAKSYDYLLGVSTVPRENLV